MHIIYSFRSLFPRFHYLDQAEVIVRSETREGLLNPLLRASQMRRHT